MGDDHDGPMPTQQSAVSSEQFTQHLRAGFGIHVFGWFVEQQDLRG